MTRLTVQDVQDLVTQARMTTLTLQSIGQHLEPSIGNITLHATIEAADCGGRLARLDEVDRFLADVIGFLADVIGSSHMGCALDEVLLSLEDEPGSSENVVTVRAPQCPRCGASLERTEMSVGGPDGYREASVLACSGCEYIQEIGQ